MAEVLAEALLAVVGVVSTATRTEGVSVVDSAGPNLSLGPMNPVVASDKLKRTEVWAEGDESVHWAGAFAVYGGHGTTASSTIVYEIEPGHRLGWQHRRNGRDPVTSLRVPVNCKWKMAAHTRSAWQCFCDSNAGKTRPRQCRQGNIARRSLSFAAAMFTQTFDNVMMPPKSHILGTPNREG